MSWNAGYGLLLLGATLVSYVGAIAIEKFRPDTERKKKTAAFAVSLMLLFSALFIYKYLNFSLAVIRRSLSLIKISFPTVEFDLVLPVGISFFTFQAAGYEIDVWRGNIRAERSFIQYALFVSFFPQLVAGPIERSRDLLFQLEEPQPFDFGLAKDGVFQMLWGYFLKMVIADRAAIFVDAVYGNMYEANGMVLIVATVLFAFQIYCDFAGYSTIAGGAAQILGIRLTRNFDSPYCALSVRDFWRRWHISLSTWFRDYVYIPIGGSRCGRLRSSLNVMIAMAVSGLWHGAGFHFIAWGCLHGALQVVERMCGKIRDRLPKGVQWLLTFFWICIGWCLFRASSLRTGLYAIKKMGGAVVKGYFFKSEELYQYFSVGNKARRLQLAFTFDMHDMHLLILCIVILLLIDFISFKGISLRSVLARQNPAIQMFSVALAVTFISIFGIWGSAFSAANFIYFQF
ncbi:MAG: MBOAT family protein [Treponema sp.]|nr:MBOAT family protein [Treponema sp.]